MLAWRAAREAGRLARSAARRRLASSARPFTAASTAALAPVAARPPIADIGRAVSLVTSPETEAEPADLTLKVSALGPIATVIPDDRSRRSYWQARRLVQNLVRLRARDPSLCLSDDEIFASMKPRAPKSGSGRRTRRKPPGFLLGVLADVASEHRQLWPALRALVDALFVSPALADRIAPQLLSLCAALARRRADNETRPSGSLGREADGASANIAFSTSHWPPLESYCRAPAILEHFKHSGTADTDDSVGARETRPDSDAAPEVPRPSWAREAEGAPEVSSSSTSSSSSSSMSSTVDPSSPPASLRSSAVATIAMERIPREWFPSSDVDVTDAWLLGLGEGVLDVLIDVAEGRLAAATPPSGPLDTPAAPLLQSMSASSAFALSARFRPPLTVGRLTFPSEPLLTSAVRLACATGHVDRGCDFLRALVVAGFPPRLRSFAPVLDACARRGDVDLAQDLWSKMENCGLVPGEGEYLCLLRTFTGSGRRLRLPPHAASGSEDVGARTPGGEGGHRAVPPSERAPSSSSSSEPPPASSASTTRAFSREDSAADLSESALSWDTRERLVLDAVSRLVEHHPVPGEALVRELTQFFATPEMARRGWRVAESVVGADGFCPVSGHQLRSVDLSEAELDLLLQQAESLGSSLPATASGRSVRRSFEAFQRWLERHGPYDVIIDAANVGHFRQNFDGGRFSHAQIDAIVRHFLAHQMKPLVVLHRRWSSSRTDLTAHFRPRSTPIHLSHGFLDEPSENFPEGGGGAGSRFGGFHAPFAPPQSPSSTSSVSSSAASPSATSTPSPTGPSVVEDFVARWQATPGLLYSVHHGNDDWFWLYAALHSEREKLRRLRELATTLPADFDPSTDPASHESAAATTAARAGLVSPHASSASAPLSASMLRPVLTPYDATFLLSNDQMRDHNFQMLAPVDFARWAERHLLKFDILEVRPDVSLPATPGTSGSSSSASSTEDAVPGLPDQSSLMRSFTTLSTTGQRYLVQLQYPNPFSLVAQRSPKGDALFLPRFSAPEVATPPAFVTADELALAARSRSRGSTPAPTEASEAPPHRRWWVVWKPDAGSRLAQMRAAVDEGASSSSTRRKETGARARRERRSSAQRDESPTDARRDRGKSWREERTER